MKDFGLSAPRRETAISQRRERAWYESQWTFFWTVVGAILTAGLIAAIVGAIVANVLAQSAAEQFQASIKKVNTEMRRAMPMLQSAVPPSIPTPRYQIFHVPPRTPEECRELTNGLINEQFQKCRTGYDVQQLVTP